MRESIPTIVKRTCCELSEQGKTQREIYEAYYKNQVSEPSSFIGFRSSLRNWKKLTFPDDTTLRAGTFDGFTAHGATVQVSARGEITQAWIKQSANAIDPEEFLKAIRGTVEKYSFTPVEHDDANGMLEIPMFDMHWGIAFMDYYQDVLDQLLSYISSKHWSKIVIPFGQDFFHNDSMVNGQTTKGTNIEKVDMERAVKEGQRFMYAIIDAALDFSDEVRVLYSSGNHDQSISWMFVQVLLERYGSDIVDDSMQTRKIISFGKNAIMVTHGDSNRATPQNLAHVFPVSFPEEFANATIREVHAGHLHTETDVDIFGVMVRRMASGCKTDRWANGEEYIGSHKRFMLFDWSLDKLQAIYYI